MSHSIPMPQSANHLAGLVLQGREAIRRLLVSQYQATGAQKTEHVLEYIGKRIVALKGNIPAICVAKRRLETAKDLVERAIAVIPFLPLFDKGGISAWFG